MSQVQVQVLIEALEMCKGQTLSTAAKVPESARLRQLAPGKAHPLWLVGHLANTLDIVGRSWGIGSDRMFPNSFPKKFSPDFAGGDPVTANAEDYPGWDEVVGSYEKVFDKFIEEARGLRDENLPEKPRAKVMKGTEEFFSSVGAILKIMVLHDSQHCGQLSLFANLPE